MQFAKFVVLGICLSLLAFLAFSAFNQSSSAQKNARVQWEYASIVSAYSFNPVRDRLNRIYGMAEICYLQSSGCKRAEIKYELDYGSYLQERAEQESFQTRKEASVKAAEIAFQKAVAQFGTEGWEIIGDPNIGFEFVNLDDYNKFDDKSVLFKRETGQAVYFKRLKTQ